MEIHVAIVNIAGPYSYIHANGGDNMFNNTYFEWLIATFLLMTFEGSTGDLLTLTTGVISIYV